MLVPSPEGTTGRDRLPGLQLPVSRGSWHRVNQLGQRPAFLFTAPLGLHLAKQAAHAIIETGLGFNLLEFKSIVLKNVIQIKNSFPRLTCGFYEFGIGVVGDDGNGQVSEVQFEGSGDDVDVWVGAGRYVCLLTI